METLLRDRLDRTPELREELSWFFQEPGQLQFFDALRVICESDGGFETVYDLGRRMAKMVVPEVHGLPGVTLEIGTKRLESLFNGFRAQVKSVGYGKAEIVTGFAPGSREGGWAFCRFVEGWLAGAVEQAAKKKVVSNKVSCVLNRGRFSFSDGELKVGPGREVVFYPKSSRTPKLVAKRSNSGRFKFRGTRFGEQCCSYRISWSPSSDELLTAIGFGPRGDRIRQGFSTALERIEEELDALRARLDEMGSFHQALLEFMRASGTIASTRELWESIARCVHRGIGLDRVAVFVIAPDGLQHVYYWDVDGRDLTTKASLNISPGSPEAKAVAEGRSVIAERLDHAAGVLPLFSQKWFSPGYVVAPIGEPPNYTHLLWADAYHKKRAPNAQEADEVNIVACAASLALSKFETIEKLEERVEERTRAQHELTLKLNRLYREVRDYEASKNRILSIVGHELKAPLNSILGLAQILLREMDGPLTLEQKQDI
ncbi:MAG TPA: hypothetical protein ENF73_03915, partial [Proteobacteria bacterium]|nr:hypothetical protein [Pseudomonadota bacterium]